MFQVHLQFRSKGIFFGEYGFVCKQKVDICLLGVKKKLRFDNLK